MFMVPCISVILVIYIPTRCSFCVLVLVYLLCLFGINEFYVHGTVHLSNTSHINTKEMQFIVLLMMDANCIRNM